MADSHHGKCIPRRLRIPAARPVDCAFRRRTQSNRWRSEPLADLGGQILPGFNITGVMHAHDRTEIAEILEIPDATVRTRLFHARKDVAVLVKSHPGFVDLLVGRRAAATEVTRD